MFDPTVYENLKVVLEGSVYDLDLAGMICVSKRKDRVDLSTMSRDYAIQFREAQAAERSGTAEIRLYATMQDLAAEIIHEDSATAGCVLTIRFTLTITDIEHDCPRIENILNQIWEGRPTVIQKLMFQYGVFPIRYINHVTLQFGRTINEKQIEDIQDLIDLTVYSLQQLNRL